MIYKLNKEFREVLRDVMFLGIRVNDAFDRVRVLQWVRKLMTQDETRLDSCRTRNEYMHFLRIVLDQTPIYFCMPFKDEPPESDLAPLPEVLANMMSDKCLDLPRTGPLRPVLCHKSPDGKAFMTVKRCPEGGVFCYLAVAPHTLAEN